MIRALEREAITIFIITQSTIRKKTWTHLTLDPTHQIRPANLTVNAIKTAHDKGQLNNMEPTKQHLRFFVRQDQAYNNPQLHQSKRNHKKKWHPTTSITTMQPIIQNSTIASISYRPLWIHIFQEAHRTKTMTFGILGITNHAKEHCIHSIPPNLPGNNKSSFEKKSYLEFSLSKNHDVYQSGQIM